MAATAVMTPTSVMPMHQARAGRAQFKPKIPQIRCISGRDIQDYQEDIGISMRRLLRATRILDLGAGFAVFGYEARKQKINVVDLDPHYRNPIFLRWARGEITTREARKAGLNVKANGRERKQRIAAMHDTSAKVAGINENLPFKDGSFDLILAVWSSLFFAKVTYESPRQRRRAIESIFKESLRVLTPNGEARFNVGHPTMVRNILREGLDGVDRHSYSYRIEPGSSAYLLKLTKRK